MGPSITNIVATACLGQKLNLVAIEAKLPMAQYVPQRFSGLLVRVLKPFKAHCHLYCNGKMTVNGARTEKDALELAQRFSAMLNSIGYDTSLSNFKIVNVVGSHNFERFIKLEHLSTKLGVHYTPELFPGLTVKLPLCTAVLFHSGKCNFVGAKSETDVYLSYKRLLFLL